MLSIHFHSASQLSIKTKVIISNLLWINITSWYHPNSLKPLTGGFHTSQEKYLVGEWFICRLYKVRGNTKNHIHVFIKSKDFTQCENTRIVFFKRNTYWGMSCGQPCNHCGFEISFPFVAYICSTTFSSCLITQISNQINK